MCVHVVVPECARARRREQVYETLIVLSPIDFGCSEAAGAEAVWP